MITTLLPRASRSEKRNLGCIDQLLINKVVSEEVRKYRRNLVTIWLDYKKAYDSVPHEWIIKTLRLAKVPDRIITAIENIMKAWKIELNLPTSDKIIYIGEILYWKGLLQGDHLSVILFILSLNPCSYLLNETERYKLGVSEERNKNLTHLLFVDDMKLYASNLEKSTLLLDMVTTFSQDIGMSFGEDKCGYVFIDRGELKQQGERIVINGVTIKELNDGELYKYLGVDENIQYDGDVSKERILKEYYRRVKAIWRSTLNVRNKSIVHNSFALSLLIPTVGILDWTIQEIVEIDRRARQILCMAGSFPRNSDVNRLYVKRTEGGRGLKSFNDSFKTRVVALNRHISRDRERNHLLHNVHRHEEQRLMRTAKEYEDIYTPRNEEGQTNVGDEKISNTEQRTMKNQGTAWIPVQENR